MEKRMKITEKPSMARDFLAMHVPDVEDLARLAFKYRLEHRNVLEEYTFDEIRSEYNGFGPDRWPSEVRDILSWLLQDILEAVLVHDMDFVKGGDENAFHEANAVLERNIRRLARKKHGIFSLRRYFLLFLAPKIRELSDLYGQEGWNWTKTA